MYYASLAVSLPKKLPKATSALERLVGLMFPPPGDPEDDDPKHELREMLRGNLSVFEALLRSFDAAGFDDVVAIVVDGKSVYVDTEERIDDLQQALEGLVKSRALLAGYAVMRTTFRREQDGMEVLGELRCHARSGDRPDETRIRLSARPLDHAPTREEGPREYAARIRASLRDMDALEARRRAIETLRDTLAAQVRAHIPDVGIDVGPAVIRFISPGRRQLGRMRHLGFGASLRTTVYCSLPSYERVGPYDDPLSRHYYSAYSDLFHWIAVGEVLAGHLPSPHVEVVTATGRRLLRGDEYGYFDASEIVPSRDVVRVSPEGRLKIDASVPDVGALDPSELGSPHSRGWGGEAWADDIDDGG